MLFIASGLNVAWIWFVFGMGRFFADAHFAVGVTVPLRPVVPDPLCAAGRLLW